MSTTTTRLGLVKPASGDPFVPHTDLGNLADALDAAAIYEQGAVGSLPTATSKPYGYWYADTATGGHIYVNVGTGGGRAYREVATVSNGNQLVAGASAASYQLSDLGATSGERRSHLWNNNGETALQSTDDAGTVETKRGFTFDHSTGAVEFPNGATVGGAPVAKGSRGAVSIATAESTSSTSYTLLTTPDRIQNIVLPTNGLIAVAYQAQMQSSISSAGRAAIFVGANQYKMRVADTAFGPAAPVTMAARSINAANVYAALGSAGQLGIAGEDNGPTSSDVTTGQGVGVMGGADQRLALEVNGSTSLSTGAASYVTSGGPTLIFAAAGTYDISVQFKATSGSVTAKERTLRVWVLSF